MSDRSGRILTIILELPDDDGYAHIVTGWSASAPDADLDVKGELYLDIDAWTTEAPGNELFEPPPATIGVHLDGDEIDALFSALDQKQNESSIDFTRPAVLERIARRQQAQRPTTTIDSNTEAAS